MDAEKNTLRYSKLIRYLRGWIGVVGLMAFGNTIQCFRDHSFLKDKLYTQHPDEISGLTARLFGTWTLLAAILRIYCSIDIQNKQIYNLTFASFLLALVHFLTEIFIFGSAKIQEGTLAPLIVSSISSLWMFVGYWYLDESRYHNESAEGFLQNTRKKKNLKHPLLLSDFSKEK